MVILSSIGRILCTDCIFRVLELIDLAMRRLAFREARCVPSGPEEVVTHDDKTRFEIAESLLTCQFGRETAANIHSPRIHLF